MVLALAAVLIALATAKGAVTPDAAVVSATPVSLRPAETPGDAGFLIVGSRNSAGFGLVRVFADRDRNGTYESLADEIVPYSTAASDGVRVAAGDFDGDGNDELVTASSENAPVEVYELTSGGRPGALLDSLTGFTQGSYVAAGDLDGDGRDELIVGSDPGAEPKVKIFADANLDGELDATPVNTFNAYPASFRGGVRVAAGNTDEPGLTNLDDEVVTAPGPNGPGQPVKIWDDTDHDRAVSDNPLDDSFLPYEPGFGGGTYVAAGPILFAGSGNLVAEVVVSAAGGQNRNVVIRTDQDGDGKVSDDPPFDQLPPPYGASFTSGVRVATGRGPSNRDDVITAPGANAGSKPVKIYRDDGDPLDFLSDNPPGDQFIGFAGNFGEFVAFATTLTATYSDTHTPLLIPDQGSLGDPLQARIQVPGSAGTIRDLDVSIDISHLFDADLDVSLQHTSSAGPVHLFTYAGHDDDGFLVWLDDEAGTDIQTVGDNPNNFPVAGVFRPLNSLTAFDGTDASGTWTLTVNDDGAPGVAGTLNSWSLKFTY